MADFNAFEKKMAEYGIRLENDMRTLRVTAQCVPREEDMKCDNPLESFVYGIRSQDHHGRWGSPGDLLGTIRSCSCRTELAYVENPMYDDEEYVDRPEEGPMCNLDPVAIALDDDNGVDMDEPEHLPDSVQQETNPAMGLSFGFWAVEEVVVDEDNPYFAARDGVLFSKDMTRLIWYPYGKQDAVYTVPDGVAEIGPWAFAGEPHRFWMRRKDGSAVQDRSGQRKYHVKYVYHRCLRRVMLPDTVTVIQDNAFNHCLRLVRVGLSSALQEIRWDAFRGCKDLQEIQLPDSLEYIEPAFEGCDNLKKVRFLGTRHQISRTWKTYSSTWYTTYPGPVPYSPDYMKALFGRRIPGKPFSKEVMPGMTFDNPWFTIIDDVMFSRDRTELIWCDRHKSGAYTVPSTVTRIGERAFADCEKLTQVTISHPGTVIEKRAFFCCRELKSVEFQGPGSVKLIGDHAFQCCEKLRAIQLTQVESIGDFAFFGCKCLGPKVTVSEDCRHIGKKAFDCCDNLRALYIPEALDNFHYWSLGCKRKSVYDLPHRY